MMSGKMGGLMLMLAAGVGMGLPYESRAVAEPGNLSVEATKHMVTECRQQHENMSRTVDELLMELETAQRSHDAAQTRAALELSQLKLADLKQEMALCVNLMNMIDRRTSDHEASERETGETAGSEGQTRTGDRLIGQPSTSGDADSPSQPSINEPEQGKQEDRP